MTRPEAVEMDQMKTDRELLELAAKAAALPLEWRTGRDGTDVPRSWVLGKEWNPADDDGDSRRLEVRLRLQVTVGRLGCGISGLSCPKDIYEEFQPGCDEMAVVRLAVLRAAAAIGEAMP